MTGEKGGVWIVLTYDSEIKQNREHTEKQT